jgi:hypothetical protein
LLRLEGSVCFGAVVGEAVDAVAGCGEGLVGVAEEADLGSAYRGGVSRCLGLRTSWCRCLGVREEYDTALALLYKLRERGLLSVMRLDFAAEGRQVN